MYSLLLLGQVGFIYSVLKVVFFEGNKQKKWIIFAVLFGVIAMYSHNLGFVGLLSVNLVLLFRRDWKVIRYLLLIQILVVIFSLPWFYFLPQQINKVQSAFWTQSPGILEVIQAFLTLFSFLPMPTISIAIVLVIQLQILVYLVLFIFRRKELPNILLFSFFLVPPLLLMILSYIVYPVFVPRIFIVSSICWFILLGSLVFETWKQGPGKIIIILFPLTCVISLVYFYQFNSFPRSQFKNLAATIQRIGSDSTPVIHDNKLSFFPTMFYYETDFQYYLQDEPGSSNDTLAKDSQLAIGYLELNNIDNFIDEEEIIFVVFQDALTEYERMNKNHPVLEELELLFDDNYQIIDIGDIKLFNFGPIK